jgi:ribulose-5-phosphate 4-epimerase/fuculose-1-phosphate aldolase
MSDNETNLRLEIVQVCHLLYQKDFICASDGNVSVRLGRTAF